MKNMRIIYSILLTIFTISSLASCSKEAEESKSVSSAVSDVTTSQDKDSKSDSTAVSLVTTGQTKENNLTDTEITEETTDQDIKNTVIDTAISNDSKNESEDDILSKLDLDDKCVRTPWNEKIAEKGYQPVQSTYLSGYADGNDTYLMINDTMCIKKHIVSKDIFPEDLNEDTAAEIVSAIIKAYNFPVNYIRQYDGDNFLYSFDNAVDNDTYATVHIDDSGVLLSLFNGLDSTPMFAHP